jgi:hypothetical protein
LGSIVQKGKLAACAFALLTALKRVLLPTLGKPTIPHCNAIILKAANLGIFYGILWGDLILLIGFCFIVLAAGRLSGVVPHGRLGKNKVLSGRLCLLQRCQPYFATAAHFTSYPCPSLLH